MTGERLSKYNRDERVLTLCASNPDAVALNSAFQTDVNRLKDVHAKIKLLKQQVESGNAHSATKSNVKAELIEVGMDICVNLNGLGLLTKDEELLKFGKLSKSKLGGGKEADFVTRCENIRTKAEAVSAELQAQRGIDSSLLTRFNDLMEDFNTVKTDPRSAHEEKLSSISELNTLCDDAETAIILLTGSSRNLKGKADNFLLRLEKALVIITPRVASTQIKALVRHAETGKRLKDVTIESQELSIGQTFLGPSAAGISTSHHKSAGFIISKEGFEPTLVANQKIKKGKTNWLKVKLVPIKSA
jgi:hypothetical protein